MQLHFWLLTVLWLPHATDEGGVGIGAIEFPKAYRAPQMIEAAIKILELYVSPRHNTLAIMDLSKSGLSQRNHRQAVTYLLEQLGERVALQLLQDIPIEEPRDHILFLVDTPRAFRALRFHFAKSLFDREFHFLILLPWPAGQHKDKMRALRDIFETCLSFHVLNAVVLLGQRDGDVQLYGYRLYAPNCREPLTPELLGYYTDGELRMGGQPVFGRRMGSFYGCPVNVSWYLLPPFVMFNGDAMDAVQRAQIWRLSGVDGELLKLLAKIYDFRIQLLPPCQKQREVNAKGNFSMRLPYNTDNCFEQLATLDSSVAIGALSASHSIRDRFSTTSAYHQSALVFVVRVEHVIGAVNQLVQPFCGMAWCALAVSCLLGVALQWAHAHYRCRRHHFDVFGGALQVQTTLLGNPVQVVTLPHSVARRLLVGLWLLLALVLRVAYQGKLYDVFWLPYYQSVPDSIAELLNGDYKYLAQDYCDYFPRNRTLLRPFGMIDRFEELQLAPPEAKLVTTSLLDNLAHYNRYHWETSRLTHIREQIYLYQLVMYLRRHSILKFAFDRKLKQLQSAGIVGNINRNFEQMLVYDPYTDQLHSARPAPLQMYWGLYFVCHVMLILALVVFVLEVLSMRVAWLRRCFS